MSLSIVAESITPANLPPEAIADLANRVTYSVLRRRELASFTPEDREDAQQIAALEIWQAMTLRPGRGEGYYFQVGKFAVYAWLRSQRTPERSQSIEPMTSKLASQDNSQDCIEIDPERLRTLANEIGLTDKILTYIGFRLRGYSSEAIAVEMGTTRRAVICMRARLLAKLEQYTGEALPPRCPPMTDAEHWQVERWLATELSMVQIAKRLKRGYGTIVLWHRRWCEQMMQAEAATA